MRDLSFQTAREKCVADELAMKANDLNMGAAAKGDPEVNLLVCTRGAWQNPIWRPAA